MKKVTFTLLLLCFCFYMSAQVLNQPANWPNTSWQVTGVFNTDPTAFEADPTVTSNFAFDDDDAGFGSDDDIAAESPVIDLTAAFGAGETWIFVDVDYVYNLLGDVLRLEYWDADSGTWESWEVFPETVNTPTNDFCTPARDSFTSIQLNIAGFSATQLSGFQYRIAFYDDGPGGGAGFEWGFCFDSPTVRSETPPTCPVVTNIAVANVTDTSAEISWTAGGSETEWEVVVQPAGTGVPTGSGVSTTNNPYTATSLSSSTVYEVYVRAVCGPSDFSNWEGPINFTTENTPPPPPNGVTCGSGSSSFIYTAEFDSLDGWTGDIGNQDGFWEIPNDSGSFNTGPDTAFSGSSFMNYEASGGTTNTASAVSPAIDLSAASDGAELSFYIHAFGEDMGTLNVGIGNSPAGPFTNLFTWIGELQTSGAQAWVPVGINIDAYLGQTIYVEFSHTGTGGFEGDMSIDFVRVETCGTFCIAPSSLNAANITANTADITWIGNNGETSWEYVIQPAGTGVPTGSGTSIGTTTLNLSALSPNTDYEVYIRANCASGDSSWAGPLNFTTDIQTNFVLDCTSGGPVTQDYCYDNGGAVNPVIFTFTSNDGTPLNLNFNSGFVENNWDELVVIDSDGNPFPGFAPADDNYGNAGNIGGLSFQSTGDTISFYINSDGIFSCATGQAPMDSGINYTVSCATCINPQATYAVVDDCDNGNQFLVDVDITDLGDATSLTISNNFNGDTIDNVTATGVYQVGPFPFLQDIIISVSNDQDGNCVINSQPIQLLACPPDNDNPCDATVAVVNDGFLCETSTPGTILAATPSGVPEPSCGGSADDDVWFQFVADSEFYLIALANISGSTTTDIDHSLYEGSCDNLTEIACTSGFAELSSFTPQLTVGNTYYIRVYSGGTDDEDTTFDLCITTNLAPANITCEATENLCSGGDDDNIIYYNNIVGQPNNANLECLGTIPNPTYFEVPIGSSGDILLEMVQNAAFDGAGNPIGDELDVDFLLWGPMPPDDPFCVNEDPFTISAPVIDCSYSAAPVENAILLGAQEGETYLLLITNFEAEAGVIQVVQTNLGDANAGTIVAELEAAITSQEAFIDPNNDPSETDIVSLCGFTEITLETNSPGADEYIWFKDGFEIVGETSSSITVTESDIYQVLAIDNGCAAQAFSQIVQVNLYQDPGNIDPQNATVCDGPEGDGAEDFDLDAISTSLGLSSDFVVSYYTNTSDANQAINAVSSPYSSSGEILIMRIEDADAAADGFLGCREISEVELVVLPVPDIGTPNDLEGCLIDDFVEFDLTENDVNVLNGASASDFTVSYHSSLVDAESGTNALASPYIGADAEVVFVRLEDNATGCFNTASFTLFVLEAVSASIATNVFYFDIDTSEFLLCPEAETGIELTIIPDGFTSADVTIQWSRDGVPIDDSNALSIEADEQGDYSATITLNSTGCPFTIDNIVVVEIENCVIPEGISPGVSIGQNDTFDLRYFNVTRLEIFNRNGTRVYVKDNYTNEWVGQTDDGEELPVGTYFYTMIYEGGSKTRSGWIYINR